ncbi:DUF1173 domain-containing protein [Paraburkholderia atlantica]|uniref:DUF1173 domain-containing protein n=1 Tax=Paraburkholderia atlantica TaxID=2654982 RepID=UPI0021A5C52F|nr:DUF1173 domain-containing protein [Paraburkholderia atlantica]
MRRLERAKVTPGYATCECGGAGSLQLVIRRYGSLLHLAGWPDDGHRHDRACSFFKDPNVAPSVRGSDSEAAILSTPTGMNVKLDAALTMRETTIGSRGTATETPSRPSRRSASLLAFLQTLWVEAALNQWTGTASSRHWGNAMGSCWLRQGRP